MAKGTSAAIKKMRKRIVREEGEAAATMDHPLLAPLYEKRRQHRNRVRARRSDRHSLNKQITKTVKYTYRASDNERLFAFYNTPEWRMVRYEALRRHGAKCQCCGREPPGVVLHVDHIRSIRTDWDLRLNVDNLQVLCGDCNEGKGARHADDWRR